MIDQMIKDTEYCLSAWYRYVDDDDTRNVFAAPHETVTRGEAELQSGKVYKYLKDKGIGKEDFVLIKLNRGVKHYVTMLGILKAGAAYVIAENDYPADRIEFMRIDTGCKLVIDEELYSEIAKGEYLRGYELTDDHDAAYAIYTSGTTGRPKGIIHEYGTIKMCYISNLQKNGLLRENEDTKFAVPAPLNFVASVIILEFCLYCGGCVYIPGYDIIKNPKLLIQYLAVNRINEAFLAPLLLRFIGQYISPDMKYIYTGSEPSHMVSVSNGVVLNNYLMSETGFIVSQYVVDRAQMDTPVGKPNSYIEVFLTDEGEVVCYTPFCRGYINLPEENAQAFKDGYYHTGDLVSVNSNGDYVIRGRLSDMFKINGNRVEPMEIEKTVALLTGLQCVCKGYENPEDSFIALYYTGETDVNEEEVRKALADRLPYYMIPSVFVNLPQIPVTPLGKIDRKALPYPQARLAEFVPPANALEERFCRIIAKVLGLRRVGMKDDFFHLGGNSMGVMAAISEMNLKGLDAKCFYRGRTIEKILSLREKNDDNLTDEQKEMEGRMRVFRLSNEAFTFYEAQRKMVTYTGWNIARLFKFNRLLDAEKMKRALNTYMDSSSTFKVMLFKGEDGFIYQRYAPEKYKPVMLENMTEEEVEELRKTFVKPYDLLKELPYRIRLIKTRKSTYLFWDMHHVICDGTGLQLISEDIAKLYLGQKPGVGHYFAHLYEEQKAEESEYFKECDAYWKNTYATKGWVRSLSSPSEVICERREEFDPGIKIKELAKATKDRNISRITIMATSMLLALAKFHKTRRPLIFWVYSDRQGVENHAGVRFKSLLVGLDLNSMTSLSQIFKAVGEQVEAGVAACCCTYPYRYESLSGLTLALNDLEDLEEIHPFIRTFAEVVPLERPYDTKNQAPANLQFMNVLNKDGKIIFRMNHDLNSLSIDGANTYLQLVTQILKMIISGNQDLLTFMS